MHQIDMCRMIYLTLHESTSFRILSAIWRKKKKIQIPTTTTETGKYCLDEKKTLNFP